MRRLYQQVVVNHCRKVRQMLFFMGPRQSGKTTATMALREDWDGIFYFNWDNQSDRIPILNGPAAIADHVKLDQLQDHPPIVIFDELHKYAEWKTFLKGLYDSYPHQLHIVVTGSARLDFFKRGGDSLMGRYFPHHFHPLSVGELISTEPLEIPLRPKPQKLAEDQWEALWEFGGYPDPFLNRDPKFHLRWKALRNQQLFRTDLRDLSRVQEVAQLEVLAELLRLQIGQLTTYESLAKKVRVSAPTIRSWIEILKALYYCYEIRPWTQNVSRSLLREPKFYLWDWSLCDGPGARAENFVASHLLKSVHYWNDAGLGEYGLHFVRDKNKREVDFLITQNRKPWVLVEVKTSDHKPLSPHLLHFHESLKPAYAFQVSLDLPYVNKSCFKGDRPLIVPARTFLSQLV